MGAWEVLGITGGGWETLCLRCEIDISWAFLAPQRPIFTCFFKPSSSPNHHRLPVSKPPVTPYSLATSWLFHLKNVHVLSLFSPSLLHHAQNIWRTSQGPAKTLLSVSSLTSAASRRTRPSPPQSCGSSGSRWNRALTGSGASTG